MEDERERVVLPDGWDELEWSVYRDRSAWPVAADLVFLPSAVEQLADALWASDDIDLDPIRDAIDTGTDRQWRVGVLWTMVNLLEPLLARGALTVHAAPVGGPGSAPLRDQVWTRDAVALAVAEGMVETTGEGGSVARRWLFLDEGEFELLRMVNSPAGAPAFDVAGNLRRRHDEMAAIIVENLAAIAGSRRLELARRSGAARARASNGADPTPWELDAMFADAPRILLARHQLALIDRVAAWLLARFVADPHQADRKKTLRLDAKAKFAPYLSDGLFNDAWKEATAVDAERAKAGRPRKSGRTTEVTGGGGSEAG